LFFGLGNGFLFGLAGGLAGGLTGGPGVRPRRTAVVETLRWSPARAGRAAAGGAVAGSLVGGAISLLMALVFGVVIALILGRPEGVLVGAAAGAIGAPFLGAFGGLHFGLLFGAVGGLVSGELRERSAPNQGIRRSARTAVLVGLGTGLLYVLAVSAVTGTLGSVLAATQGWSVDWRPGLRGLVLGTIPGGLLYALIGGLAYGGYACLSHAALRLILWRAGSLPLDAVRFLDHAAELAFLRKAGGGYLFVHRLLQEHFAALGGGPPSEGPSARE
jgi:eukaryotic-like serine/threonine-protein kinase